MIIIIIIIIPISIVSLTVLYMLIAGACIFRYYINMYSGHAKYVRTIFVKKYFYFMKNYLCKMQNEEFILFYKD